MIRPPNVPAGGVADSPPHHLPAAGASGIVWRTCIGSAAPFDSPSGSRRLSNRASDPIFIAQSPYAAMHLAGACDAFQVSWRLAHNDTRRRRAGFVLFQALP